jgi:protein TonB
MIEREPITAKSMMLDQPWQRLPWLIPTALLLWALMLTAFAHILNERLETPLPVPIEVGLLGGGSTGIGASGVDSGAPSMSSTSNATSPTSVASPAITPKAVAVEKPREEFKPPPVATPPIVSTPAAKETPIKALTKPKPVPTEKAVRPSLARTKKAKPPHTAVHRVAKTTPPPSPSAPTKTNAAPAPATVAAKTGAPGTAPAGTGASAGNETGAGGTLGSASGGAQAIYAPIPKIPDDLRADVFHAEAVARFQVLPDGTSQVVLVRPTPNPRLNYLLLETLKQWRFFPAVRGGKAVASMVEIRIPIAIE